MRFQLLPGLSQLFIDYAEGRAEACAVLAPRPDLPSLCAHAEWMLRSAGAPALQRGLMSSQAAEFRLPPGSLANIARLADGMSVAVASFHEPALYGGVLRDMAKAWTAIRLARELERCGIPAVPVFCGTGRSRGHAGTHLLGFVDGQEGFQGMSVALPEGRDPGGRPCLLVPAEADDFLKTIGSRLGLEWRNPSALDLFRVTHPVGSPLTRAWGRLMGELLASWGPIVLDLDRPEIASQVPDNCHPGAAGWAAHLEERAHAMAHAGYGEPPPNDSASIPAPLALACLLPVAAIVAGPGDINDLALVWNMFGKAGRPRPIAWLQASLTLVEQSSRKTMSKYAIPFEAVFQGADSLAASLWPAHKLEEPLRGLEEMRALLASAASQLSVAKGEERGRDLRMEAPVRRIDYQLRKLQDRCRRHHDGRRGVIRQRLKRMCHRLAPDGALQEERLPVVQIQAEYSGAALAELVDKIDIQVFEHQVLDWD